MNKKDCRIQNYIYCKLYPKKLYQNTLIFITFPIPNEIMSLFFFN